MFLPGRSLATVDRPPAFAPGPTDRSHDHPPHYTLAPVAAFILIVAAGALGTFIGILTVIAKNERTTNRNQLLSNIGGSIALAAIVCLVPGGIVYVFTDNLAVTGFAALLSGFVAAWVIDEIDH